jgi:hypothetical protein
VEFMVRIMYKKDKESIITLSCQIESPYCQCAVAESFPLHLCLEHRYRSCDLEGGVEVVEL